MHVTIPYSSGTVETVMVDKQEFDFPVPAYPSSGEITNPGEIAISTLDGYEAICIKSDQNENVLFSNDAANQAKLSSWYNSKDGGLSLAQNNEHGPVLSLSEGVALNNQPIIKKSENKSLSLYLTGYRKQSKDGYSLTPFKDSEPCAVFNYTTDLPDNLNEMKDIRFNVRAEGASTSCEITINNGADIRTLKDGVFFCDCVHGLENLEPSYLSIQGLPAGTAVYWLKDRIVSDITASFAVTTPTGCRAVASHAEGSNSTTYAVGSHVEGHNTLTSDIGKFSHSEGYYTNALGLCSSAHNSQSSTNTGATASSVYGYLNGVTDVGEFACGQSNVVASSGMLFSIGDGTCIEDVVYTSTPTFQALCSPHNVFKILFDDRGDYYYPLIDIRDTSRGTRNLVITATVGGGDPQTKTLDEWYTYLTSGGN
jgi:hypothetical protein